MFSKKFFLIFLLLLSLVVYSKEQVPTIYDEDMPLGSDFEILFESPN